MSSGLSISYIDWNVQKIFCSFLSFSKIKGKSKLIRQVYKGNRHELLFFWLCPAILCCIWLFYKSVKTEIKTQQNMLETTIVIGVCLEPWKVPRCKNQKDGAGFKYKLISVITLWLRMSHFNSLSDLKNWKNAHLAIWDVMRTGKENVKYKPGTE